MCIVKGGVRREAALHESWRQFIATRLGTEAQELDVRVPSQCGEQTANADLAAVTVGRGGIGAQRDETGTASAATSAAVVGWTQRAL